MFNARVSTHDAQIPKAIYTTPKASPIAIEAWWHGLCQTRQKLHLSKSLQSTNRIFPKYNEARGRANKAIRSWMLHGSCSNVHQEKNASRRIAHQTCPKLKPHAVSALMEQGCKHTARLAHAAILKIHWMQKGYVTNDINRNSAHKRQRWNVMLNMSKTSKTFEHVSFPGYCSSLCSGSRITYFVKWSSTAIPYFFHLQKYVDWVMLLHQD